MSDPDRTDERAARLVAWHDEHRKHVIALATAVALAVHVEPGLLRKARLRMRPPVGVAVETDLWFSPLVGSYSLRGLVLDSGVAAILRGRLALNRASLDDARAFIHDAHENAAPTLRLEEDLIYAALTNNAASVHALLEDVLRTLKEQPGRAPGIAQWADRALPAMPKIVRDDPGAGELLAIVERALEAPVLVGVQLTRKGIEVSEPPVSGAAVLELPASPLRLEARSDRAPESPLIVNVSRGRVTRHRLPRVADDGVTLATADGRTARLTPARARAEAPGVAAEGGRKRLVVCCDGTWSLADQVGPTNVSKLYRAVAMGPSIAQVVHYDPGVGTRRWDRIRAGGPGGLARSVMESYRFLVEQYTPGDELFLIGGSRGATVVRSLVGLIRSCGILRREHLGRVSEAYSQYRSVGPSWMTEEERFRSRFSHAETEIQFVGVFDTVGTRGIPSDPFRPGVLMRRYVFHDLTLSRRIRNAYHAVAIDERRRGYEPTPWLVRPGLDTVEGQTCVQAWFPGVHADVVGGYPDSDLSEIPLLWMAQKAQECGLFLRPDHLVVTERPDAAQRAQGIEVAPDPLGRLHDSLNGFERLLRPRERRLSIRQGMPVGIALASSAVTRYERDSSYRPPGLADWLTGDGTIEEVPLALTAGERSV
jgi:hypothetical protein